MATARVIAIAAGVSLQAKDASGNWRDLAVNDEILDQEEIFVRAHGPQFGLNAYKLQRRSGGSWVDALNVVLNAQDGSSHWRQDKFAISGDSTDSTTALLLTVAKGCRQTAHDLGVLQVMQTDCGGNFTYPPGGALFKGVFSSVERTSELAMGGFEEGIDAQIVSDRAQWVNVGAPVVGQEILWHDDRSKYRIVKVDIDEISYVIGLASVNK